MKHVKPLIILLILSLVANIYISHTSPKTVTNAPVSTPNIVKSSHITPNIVWNTPNPIAQDTPLSSLQLNAFAVSGVSQVQGNFVYNLSPGVLLNAGEHILTCTFTPDDLTRYTRAEGSTKLTVTHKTPTITWSCPGNVKSGSVLTSSQLNAQANIPGVFIYTPVIGTTVNTTTVLKTVFTPLNSNYCTVESNVILGVYTPVEPVLECYNTQIIDINAPPQCIAKDPVTSSVVEGTFISSYVISTGMKPAQYSVIFNPVDTNNYTSASTQYSFRAGQAQALKANQDIDASLRRIGQNF